MARVVYAGKFDPEQIPGVRRSVATRADIAGYAKASGPKAAAIHARGVLTVSTGAPTQALAEARALKVCNDDEGRARRRQRLLPLRSRRRCGIGQAALGADVGQIALADDRRGPRGCHPRDSADAALAAKCWRTFDKGSRR